MSTRSQVKVIGTIGEGSQMLYHHTDGYPDYMIPLLKSAAKLALDNSSAVKCDHKDAIKFSVSALPWEAGRVGKAASALCASDPLVMEPDANQLHGDIAYFYRLYLVDPSGSGHCGERVQWDIEVLTPNTGFWDNPTEENMTVTLARKPLHKVTKRDIKIASQR